MQAVVVEGYTDVMACHLAGVETAIATCGTAFGDEHIKILRRLLMDQNEFRGEVVFTFDGDAAGQKAALKAFEDDQKFVTQTFVAVEPERHGPVRAAPAQGRHGGARPGRPAGAAVRVRDPVDDRHATTSTPPRAAPRRPGPAWRSSGRSGTCRCAATTPARSPAGSAWPTRTSWSVPPAATCARSAVARPRRRRPAPAPTRATRRCRSSATCSRSCCRRRRWPTGFDELDAVGVHRAAVRRRARRVVAAGGLATAGAGGAEWVAKVDARGRRRRRTPAGPRARRRAAARPTTQALTRYATEVLARLEELAATRRIAEVKSRLQRLNPVEQSGEYNRLVRRARRARGAPPRAARAGDRHAVMTSIADSRVNGTRRSTSVIGCG